MYRAHIHMYVVVERSVYSVECCRFKSHLRQLVGAGGARVCYVACTCSG